MKSPMLVTMSGPSPVLEDGSIDVTRLSNFEAGLAMMGLIHRVYPDVTFGELPKLAYAPGAEFMGRGFWERQLSHVTDTLSPGKVFNSVSSGVGDVKDGIGDVLKDTFNSSGDAGGNVVRLLTNKKVIDGANSSYASFTDSGGIVGAIGGKGISNIFGGGDSSSSGTAGNSLMDWITHLGAATKAKAAQADMSGLPGGLLPWAVGASVVLFVVFGRREVGRK